MEEKELPKPRPIRELLIVLKNYIIEKELSGPKQYKGLCSCIISLRYQEKLISTDEYDILSDYVLSNRPRNPFSKWCDNKRYNNPYWWEPGDMNIRLEWLKYKISKLK